MDNLPKLKALVDGLKKAYKARGYLLGCDGRKIFVRSEHMLLVYLLQSAEAIMMKVATLFAHKYVAKYESQNDQDESHKDGRLLVLAHSLK